MIYRLFHILSTLFHGLYVAFHRIWYQYIPAIDEDNELILMNYGYHPHRPTPKTYHSAYEKQFWTRLQMYDHLVQTVALRHKTVLELGSGRGGGASFIARYHGPETMLGVDLAESAARFSGQHHDLRNLIFLNADAHNLPFASGSIDVVLTIEAANLFRSKTVCLAEVHRVLSPTGHLLFSDFLPRSRIEDLRRSFERAGFKVQKEEDITPCVVNSLDFDHDFKIQTISEKSPRLLCGTFRNFAGTKDSYRYRAFYSGRLRYMEYVLRKTAA